tara:strand:- start:7821 stop:7997 length:177 start_codon:yes stop_codon:yes gene_type:complete
MKQKKKMMLGGSVYGTPMPDKKTNSVTGMTIMYKGGKVTKRYGTTENKKKQGQAEGQS